MDTKSLKDKILQLAIQGKLVPQDENDEPASILLERIKKEKEQLIKDKKIKKEKSLPEITEDEIPYELPNGWEWVRLGNISKNIHYGYTASAKEDIDEIKLLRITDIQNNKVNWKNVPYCDIDNNKFETYKLENDDILIARTGGTIGKSFIVKNINYNSVFASYLIRVVPLKNINANYLKLFLETPLYWNQLIIKSQGTGQPNVNATSLKELLIPFPPLNEQKRIVKKIDSLFNLVNELENNKQDLLHNISNVRNKALQLAMKGKLVPQDENDEPVSVLLEKIKKEKEQLIKDKKLQKEKPLSEITEDEIPYELPNNWVWVRLGDLSNYIKAGGDKPKDFSEIKTKEYNIPVIANGKINNGIIGYTNEAKEFNTCITISARGTIGYSFIRKDPFCPIVRLIVVCPNKHINFSYLDYAFKYFLAEGVGTSVKQLTVPMIKPKIIPLPPLEEQNRIVEKLDSIMQLCDELESELNN